MFHGLVLVGSCFIMFWAGSVVLAFTPLYLALSCRVHLLHLFVLGNSAHATPARCGTRAKIRKSGMSIGFAWDSGESTEHTWGYKTVGCCGKQRVFVCDVTVRLLAALVSPCLIDAFRCGRDK